MATYGKCRGLLSRKKLFPLVRILGLKTSSASNSSSTPSRSASSSVGNINEISKIRPFCEMPGPRGLYRIPYIGPLLHFKPFTNLSFGEGHLLFERVLDKYGPVARLDILGSAVLISDHEHVEQMYKQEGKYPFRAAIDILASYYQRTDQKPDIASLNGEEWYHLRSALNKRVLKANSMVEYIPEQSQVADDFVDLLARDGDNFDYPANDGPLFWYSAESVGVVTYNTRIGFLDKNPDDKSKDFRNATSNFIRALCLTMSGSLYYKIFGEKIYQIFSEALEVVLKETERYILLARQDLEARKKSVTFDPEELNVLLSLVNDVTLAENDVINMVHSMYIAAVDPTGSALQSVFYLLATNPDKQDKLREEVYRVLGRDGPYSREAVNEMSYLRGCLKESFRCLNVLPLGANRLLQEDAVIGGYHVPAGVTVYNINARIRRKGFERPDEYIPERWLRGEDNKPKVHQSLLWAARPFSIGPRSCVGKRIAEQEIYLAIIKTVQRLKIGLKPESWNTPFYYNVFIRTPNPLKFTFTEI